MSASERPIIRDVLDRAIVATVSPGLTMRRPINARLACASLVQTLSPTTCNFILRALVWHPLDAKAYRIAVCVLSLGCLLTQSVWTDGSSILSVGLDQRLRCWELRRSQQHSADFGAGHMPAADDGHRRTSADAMAAEAVLEIQEIESYATQVLEPAALHVVCRKAQHEQGPGWVVGVVGRGTELIRYTRTL